MRVMKISDSGEVHDDNDGNTEKEGEIPLFT